MADETDVLELTDIVEGDEPEIVEEGDVVEAPEGDDDDITFGDEEAPSSVAGESAVIRQLRDAQRKAAKENAELRKLIKPVEVGPKPDLWENCEGDTDKYDTAMDAWRARKAEAEKVTADIAKPDADTVAVWQATKSAYDKALDALPYADKAACEDVVTLAFSNEQQAALLMASDDPAKVVMALGRNPAKLAELAAIKNPFKLASAVAKLEGKIQVKSKRIVPAPETIATGTGSVVATGDKTLARLEAEADKTGDRSKLAAYRYAQRQAGK
jgi:hypothetical protein